jgi:hypothetical protein
MLEAVRHHTGVRNAVREPRIALVVAWTAGWSCDAYQIPDASVPLALFKYDATAMALDCDPVRCALPSVVGLACRGRYLNGASSSLNENTDAPLEEPESLQSHRGLCEARA